MNTFIIKNVNIVTDHGIIENGFIFVKRGIIQNVERAGPVNVHRSCRLIDGMGAFLMPGFIDICNGQLADAGDTFFHTVEKSLVQHGITSVYHLVPEYDNTSDNKWNHLRSLGRIHHQFLTRLPEVNSYYIISALALQNAAPVSGTPLETVQHNRHDNPAISDMMKHPSLYIMCSDSIEAAIPECIRTLEHQYHMPFEDAIRLISSNPARAFGIDGRVGAIRWGKRADLVLADKRQDRLEISKVFVNGRIIFDLETEHYKHEK